MNEMTKIWLVEMIDNEIKETNGNISNNTLWAHGSETPEIAENFIQTISELEDYKQLLLTMKNQIESEGKINV